VLQPCEEVRFGDGQSPDKEGFPCGAADEPQLFGASSLESTRRERSRPSESVHRVAFLATWRRAVGFFSFRLQEVNTVYSMVLMMALSTGGDLQAAHCGGGRHGGGSCGGGAVSCGGGHRGHHRMGGHGHAAGGCSTCGGGYASGCSTCGGGYAYAPMTGGCPTCAGGACPIVAAVEPSGAVIVVALPADATLTIDGEATVSTSEKRIFVSPALESGREFRYTLKAEVVRDGKKVVMQEIITVRAGEETKVTLEPTTAVAER
jgi:uncharacterized protein (TIGR03000 family)